MKRPGPVLGAVLAWLVLALPWLDRSPALWSDEAWFTQPAWLWWTEGSWATPMVVGFHGLDTETWWMPPGFSVLLVPVLALLGPVPTALRGVSVALGALGVAAATDTVRRLYDARLAWLVGLWLATHPYLLRAGRQVRMDIAVAAMVAVVLWAWWGRGRSTLGALALAASCWLHPIGWVWTLALGLTGRRFWRLPAAAVLGVGLAALGAWFWQGGTLAAEQLAANGASLAPDALLHNVLAEPQRYLRWWFPLGMDWLRARWLPALAGAFLVMRGVAHTDRGLLVGIGLAALGMAVLPNKTWLYGVPFVVALALPLAAGLATLRPRLRQGIVLLGVASNLAMVGAGFWRDRADPEVLRPMLAELHGERVLGSGWLWLLDPSLTLWDVWSFAADPPGPVARLDEVDAVLVRAWEVEHVLPQALQRWLQEDCEEVRRVSWGREELLLFRPQSREPDAPGAGLLEAVGR